ncbi:MAG: PadR family transcriptional regulator [bacterium]
MSVRHSLLAILAEQPAHGYGVKSRFERSTAGAWPLNVGQVYTTLRRLERDGLVAAEGASEGARQAWSITDAGRAALSVWFGTPISGDPPSRDELALKVLLAVAADAVDVGAILQSQRVATLERLQQYTLHKRDADPERELPWMLLLDALILKAEAEVKWLDLCEERLRRRRR